MYFSQPKVGYFLNRPRRHQQLVQGWHASALWKTTTLWRQSLDWAVHLFSCRLYSAGPFDPSSFSMCARFIGDWLAGWLVVFMLDMKGFVFWVFLWEEKEIFWPCSNNKNQVSEHHLMKIAFLSLLITNVCNMQSQCDARNVMLSHMLWPYIKLCNCLITVKYVRIWNITFDCINQYFPSC